MNNILTKRLKLFDAPLVIFVLLLLSGCELFGTLPTDSEIEAILATKRQHFAELVSMSNQDQHVLNIAFDWFSTDQNVPKSERDRVFPRARWNKYLVLFSKIGCSHLSRRNPQGTIYFMMGSNGSVISSTTKGLVYSPVKLSPIVKSLDGDVLWDEAQKTGKMTEAYVDLGQGWYIFKTAY